MYIMSSTQDIFDVW